MKGLGQIDVQFKINEQKFADIFPILPSLNSVVLRNPFFCKYSIEIIQGENILKLPEMTFELNEVKTPSEGRKTIPKRHYPVVMSQKVIIKPQHQEILQTKLEFRNNLEKHTGTVKPDEDLENNTDMKLSSSVVTIGNDNTV